MKFFIFPSTLPYFEGISTWFEVVSLYYCYETFRDRIVTGKTPALHLGSDYEPALMILPGRSFALEAELFVAAGKMDRRRGLLSGKI